MMPFRFGYACSSACVSFAESVGLSLPYAVLTSFMFLYFGFFSAAFMNLIHVFWFGSRRRGGKNRDLALVADLRADPSTWNSPIAYAVGGLTKIVRASLATSPS